jgi:hypothetical protein
MFFIWRELALLMHLALPVHSCQLTLECPPELIYLIFVLTIGRCCSRPRFIHAMIQIQQGAKTHFEGLETELRAKYFKVFQTPMLLIWRKTYSSFLQMDLFA